MMKNDLVKSDFFANTFNRMFESSMKALSKVFDELKDEFDFEEFNHDFAEWDENENGYLLVVPFKKAEVTVDDKNRVITISSEEKNDGSYISSTKSISFPHDADISTVDAEYVDEHVEVTVKKYDGPKC